MSTKVTVRELLASRSVLLLNVMFLSFVGMLGLTIIGYAIIGGRHVSSQSWPLILVAATSGGYFVAWQNRASAAYRWLGITSNVIWLAVLGRGFLEDSKPWGFGEWAGLAAAVVAFGWIVVLPLWSLFRGRVPWQ
jgi:hypothetical protein